MSIAMSMRVGTDPHPPRRQDEESGPVSHYNQGVLRGIFIYVAVTLAVASAAQADSSTVLVFPFENSSNDRTLDWIGEGISELIIERLQPEPAVYIFTREE